MNLREAAERMRELFPGRYTTVRAEMLNQRSGEVDHRFEVYAQNDPALKDRECFLCSGRNLPALISLAAGEAERRRAKLALGSDPTQQDASAAAECLTQEGLTQEGLTQALTAAAGPEYTAAEHERAGARLAADVAGVMCSLCDRPSGSCLCSP